jgi:hypothetical protein
LEKRIEELRASNAYGPRLTGSQHYYCQSWWLRVNFTHKEWDEWVALHQRKDKLLNNKQRTAEETQEIKLIGDRMCEIGHDQVLQRSIQNRDLRTETWPEFAPRVLRLQSLLERKDHSRREKKEMQKIFQFLGAVQVLTLDSRKWKNIPVRTVLATCVS